MMNYNQGRHKMTSLFNNQRASKELLEYISGILNFTEMNDFETQYTNLVEEYQTRSDLHLLSSIKTKELDSFKSWNTTTINPINFALLICKMLKGDIFALSLYDNLKQLSEDQSLVFSYAKIYQTQALQEEFYKHGGSEDARAILTAEYWLQSKEAVSIIGNTPLGIDSLCLVNSMLHISNHYIDCNL